MANMRFFIDFDGTISLVDVVDAVLERFALKEWKAIERQWTQGRIGSRACLAKQMDLVRASKKQLQTLVDSIRIDPHFAGFLRLTMELGMPVTVLSDGFDFIIRRVLKKALQKDPGLLKHLDIYCNRLRWDKHEGPKAVFSGRICAHGCATCKPALIKKLSVRTDEVIFIGDGFSDRFAAKVSDLCFAKHRLLDYCKKEEIPHLAYEHFGQIRRWLRQRTKGVLIERASECLCCSAA
jgi:2-hydroxy-3-keto-5-methylthiopentenyl-1-phosphate phosphatase